MGAVVPRPSIPRRRAQAWALQAEIELDDALLGRVPADKRFEDVLRRYARDISPGKRGARPESLRIDALCRNELAKVALRSLSASDFAQWRDRRLKQVSAGSVLREMNLLSHVCSVAVREWGWLPENFMSRVNRPSTPPARTRRIHRDEIDRLLVACGYRADGPLASVSARVGAVMLFAIETAMRAGEITQMTWCHVDLDRRLAHIP